MDLENKLRQELEEVIHSPLVDLTDIPKVDLYMEQVTSFFDDELGSALGKGQETAFTKTMINNYTKAGVLPRPVKKKYGRQHMVLLTYIFLFKQILSIQDIGRCFRLLDGQEEEMEPLYGAFHEMVDEYREQYAACVLERQARVEAKLEEHGIDNERNRLMMLISLMSLEATSHKMVCDRLLEDADALGQAKKTEEKKPGKGE